MLKLNTEVLKKRIKNLENNGYSIQWIADKIGINRRMLFQLQRSGGSTANSNNLTLKTISKLMKELNIKLTDILIWENDI